MEKIDRTAINLLMQTLGPCPMGRLCSVSAFPVTRLAFASVVYAWTRR